MIIISDVHGCYDTLIELVKQFPEGQELVFVGDLIDRGPKSAQVIDFVRKNNHKTVLGNHEDMMMMACFTNYRQDIQQWLKNGGEATLKSYGVIHNNDFSQINQSAQMKDDAEWMMTLPYYLEFPKVKNKDGRYLLVSHSSAHTVWKYKDDDNNSFWFKSGLLWNRIRDIKPIDGIYNIFGHTPVDAINITDHYVNIDSGCVYNIYKSEGYGKLTAIQFPEMIIYQQENIDKVELDEE